MPKQIITANRLSDGAVVYMTETETWSRDVDRARVIDKAEAEATLAAAERAVQACEIVTPYAIDIEIDGTHINPMRFREQIRALGPTQPGLGQSA